jgi:hypothetical protein
MAKVEPATPQKAVFLPYPERRLFIAHERGSELFGPRQTTPRRYARRRSSLQTIRVNRRRWVDLRQSAQKKLRRLDIQLRISRRGEGTHLLAPPLLTVDP